MLQHTRKHHNNNAPDHSFDSGTAADGDYDNDDSPNERRLLIGKT